MAHGGWRVRIVWMFSWNFCLKHTHSSAAPGFVKSKGASRRTWYVDTKIYFTQAWTMEPGQRCTVTVNNSLTAPHSLGPLKLRISMRWVYGGGEEGVGAKWHFPPIIASDVKLTWTPR